MRPPWYSTCSAVSSWNLFSRLTVSCSMWVSATPAVNAISPMASDSSEIRNSPFSVTSTVAPARRQASDRTVGSVVETKVEGFASWVNSDMVA